MAEDRNPRLLTKLQALISKRWLNIGLQILFLAILIFGTQFLHFKQLGFYEDDYAQVTPPLGWSLGDYRDYLKWVLTWPQGRPGQYFFTGTLGYIGAKLGGIQADYLIAFAILAFNAVLVYFLLRKLGLKKAAWLGALVFALFPADTTHPFLMHGFGLQPSLTFLLIASLLYLSDHLFLAYLVGFGSLITYESPYPVFLALPLLALPWDRELPKKLLRHFIRWSGFVVVVIGLRLYLGEGRMVDTFESGAGGLTILKQIILSFFIGPATSLWSFIAGPIYVVKHWQPVLITVLLAAGLGILVIVLLNRIRKGEEDQNSDRRTLGQLILTAVVMLILAYSFSFTHYPPTTLNGRLTSVHLAASVGVALLMAGLYEVVRRSVRGRSLKMVLTGGLILFLAVLSVYQYSIQKDYVQAWHNQIVFWQGVLTEAPDIKDGEVLAAISDDVPETHFILSHSWAEPLMLPQIFHFPTDWERQPRLYFFTEIEKTIRLRTDGSGQDEILSYQWIPHWVPIPKAGLIALDWQDGRMVRQFGVWEVDGGEMKLKDQGQATLDDYVKAPLFHTLFKNGLEMGD